MQIMAWASGTVTYQVCGTALEDSSVTMVAPAGSTFTSVEFASYGTPTGTCGAFALGGCHAVSSLSIVQGYLIGQSGTINIPATNAVFGDPCSGTPKRLYVQATASGSGGGGGTPTATVTVNTTNTKTASLTNNYSFTYGSSLAAGSFVVVVLTARGISDWTGLTDTAGNTYTEYVQGNQAAGITFTAIYYATLAFAVTAATIFTATSTGTPTNAQHATVYQLTGVTAPSVSATSQPASTTTPTVSAVTVVSGAGVAINGISTGLVSAPTITSVSAGFTSGSSLRTSGCSQFTAYRVYDTSAGSTISNTFTMNNSGSFADVIALFLASSSISSTAWTDLTGNNNATLVNSPTFTSTGSGSYFTFNGTTQEVTTTKDYSGTINSNSFTFFGWFRTSSASGRKIIGFQNNQTGTGVVSYDKHVYVNTSGQLVFGVFNGALQTITSAGTVNNGVWRSFAAVYNNAGNDELFIDGVSVGTMNVTSTDTEAFIRIAGYALNSWTGASNGYWPGDLAVLAMYNRALSASEILSNHDNTKARFGL